MRYYAGVDPGATGGVVVLNEDGVLIGIWDTGGFPGWSGLVSMVVEQQHAFPNITATTNFKMGQGSGYWRGWCRALGIGLEEVSAGKWQRAICGTLPRERKAKKKAICEWARRRWPQFADRFVGPRGAVLDGLSDAACIALYAVRLGQGTDLLAREAGGEASDGV